MTLEQDAAARRRGREVGRLRFHWGDWYEISCSGGGEWVATRHDDPATVLRTSTSGGLHEAMLADHTSRPIRPVADYD